jgi:Zn-dependent protease
MSSAAAPTPTEAPASAAHTLAEVRAAFLGPQRVRPGAFLLPCAVALYALVACSGEAWGRYGLLLLGVLLLHEAGLWLGMRAHSFRNSRLFFLPFPWPPPSGRISERGTPAEEAVALLVGALPGLALGCVLLLLSMKSVDPMTTAAGTLLIVFNGLSLLPVVPLDGGKLFQRLLFHHSPLLEPTFTALVALGLLGVAFRAEDEALGVLCGVMLLGVPRQVKRGRAAHHLRTTHPEVEQPPDLLDAAALHALHAAAASLAPAGASLPRRVRLMQELHERTRQQPASVGPGLGLGLVWALGVAVALGGVALLQHSPRFPEWRPYEDREHGFSVLLPGPPRLVPGGYEDMTPPGTQPLSVVVQLSEWNQYAVTVWELPPDMPEARRDQVVSEMWFALVRREVSVPEAFREMAGRPFSEWTYTVYGNTPSTGGLPVAHATLRLGRVDGRVFMLRARRDARMPEDPGEARRFFDSFRPAP